MAEDVAPRDGINAIAYVREPFRTDIQGLRAVAVLLVVFYHSGFGFSGGYIGVDVFFVISGYLITLNLLQAKQLNGRVRLGEFYNRRVRRLLPAATLVVVVCFVMTWFFVPFTSFHSVLADGLASVTWLSNIRFAFGGVDYLSTQSPSPFQHFWSLAVEEQFYLLWPALIVLFCLGSGPHWRRRVGLSTLLMVVLSLFVSELLVREAAPFAYFSLPSRAWELGLGALVAVYRPVVNARVNAFERANPVACRFACNVVVFGALTSIVVAALVYNSSTDFPGLNALVPTVAVAAIMAVPAHLAGLGASRLLQFGVFQFFGRISYSLYLWHWPIIVVPGLHVWPNLSVLIRLSLFAVAVGLALVTFKYVEHRWVVRRTSGDGVPMRRQGFIALRFATACILIGSLSASILILPVRTDSGIVANGWSMPAVGQAVLSPFVPSNLKPDLLSAAGDLPAVYGQECNADFLETSAKVCRGGDARATRSIVLYGDSHAAQWFPALDRIGHIENLSVLSYTKSSCPSIDVDVWNASLDRPYSECDIWRDNVLREIAKTSPEIVVVSNFQFDEIVSPSLSEAIDAGVSGLLAGLPSSSAVFSLEDNPRFLTSPVDCLALNLDDVKPCFVNYQDGISSLRLALERKFFVRQGASVITTRNWFCPGDVCSPIQGDLLLYRDRHHITATYAAQMADVLAAELGL
ncbi:acyltransferase family protein [Rhodococcoides fascians]|uniref:acyltransferase family protein n=1 Tax=Rhodococcoides fascians TaxID=1828 RepID=UPI001DB0322F|nr:acyltransferase family protein [Rhodococcus fascians]CAH0153735.1 O-acetyltransferase OatA [Rhodococcus fascians]